MRSVFPLPDDARLRELFSTDDHSVETAMKNFRYVVASVNGDAQKVWADMWTELRPGFTPGGMVLPEMSEGFTPSCGWAEFMEKMWLLKHYLDYVQRFCSASAGT